MSRRCETASDFGLSEICQEFSIFGRIRRRVKLRTENRNRIRRQNGVFDYAILASTSREMERARSPLLIPPERGTAFRVVISTLLIAVAAFVGLDMIEGLHGGRVFWATRFGHGHIDRALHPTGFWIVDIAYLAICGWLLYISMAEIRHALQRKERR